MELFQDIGMKLFQHFLLIFQLLIMKVDCRYTNSIISKVLFIFRMLLNNIFQQVIMEVFQGQLLLHKLLPISKQFDIAHCQPKIDLPQLKNHYLKIFECFDF